ncbi:MAG: hypothetical protein LBK60_04905 [Verrucomicrobiales bacterium]|jgi:hypothetical protein|nr:hypothetical protein [Verrucomicrobiales bacterium]
MSTLAFFRRALPLALAALTASAAPRSADESSAFGSLEKKDAALIGIFYDFKRTQKGGRLQVNYMKTIGDFLNSNWDESALARFFRAARPVYATEVFIPNVSAGAAPKAFGLEGVVEPCEWIVVYKGQVSPPADGTYRFVGIADDVMAVAVNGKTVLFSHYQGTNYSNWREPEPDHPNIRTVEGKLRHGDWFDCRKDQIIDLDILIGEWPGTLFGAWVFIEKKGVAYPFKDDPKHGRQYIYPVFQVAAKPIPAANQPIPYTTDSPPWTCHQ